MRCVICLNGDTPEELLLKDCVQNSYVIATDGACEYLEQYGVLADLVVGDFDSYPYERSCNVLKNSGSIVKHKVEKDYTDGQLALSEATDRGFKNIVLLGALGGRLDHALENIRLLQSDADVTISIKCNDCEIFLLKGYKQIKTDAPCTVSILPYTDEVLIEKTVGFKYPAENLVLTKLQSSSHSGLSNILLSDNGEIYIKRGEALVFKYSTVL